MEWPVAQLGDVVQAFISGGASTTKVGAPAFKP